MYEGTDNYDWRQAVNAAADVASIEAVFKKLGLFAKATADPADPHNLKFGEHIGGSRYDKAKRLTVEALKDMNEKERIKFTLKKHIIKKPDYKKMVYEGDVESAEVAYALKKIYDSIPTKPDKLENQELYISELTRIDGLLKEVYSEEDLFGLKDKIFPTIPGEPFYSSYLSKHNAAYKLLGKMKFIKVSELSEWDMNRYRKQIAKTGWPETQEAWKRGIVIRKVQPSMAEFKSPGYKPRYEIIKVKGNKKWIVKRFEEKFDTEEEAEKYLNEVLQPQLKEALKRGRGFQLRPELDEIKRTGRDHRFGKDISRDDFLNEFGFRGGEFGKWVKKKEQQEVLNHSFDALADLAGVLGISRRALSLNGELGYAMGARGGGGKASAHYEPAKVVINLTKTKGAGALAHEWGHALDDFFGKSAGLKGGETFLSQRIKFRDSNSSPTPLPDTLLDTWRDVMNIMSERSSTLEDEIKDLEADIAKSVRYAKSWLDSLRVYLEHITSRRSATSDELEEWDKLAKEILDGKHQPYIIGSSFKLTMRGIDALYKRIKNVLPPMGHRNNLANNVRFLLERKEKLEHLKNNPDDYNYKSITSDFKKGGEKLDKGKKKYWSTKIEMFARAFESYIFDKIAEQSNISQYLVHGTTTPEAYPAGDERKAINKAFDRLMDEIRKVDGFSDDEVESDG